MFKQKFMLMNKVEDESAGAGGGASKPISDEGKAQLQDFFGDGSGSKHAEEAKKEDPQKEVKVQDNKGSGEFDVKGEEANEMLEKLKIFQKENEELQAKLSDKEQKEEQARLEQAHKKAESGDNSDLAEIYKQKWEQEKQKNEDLNSKIKKDVENTLQKAKYAELLRRSGIELHNNEDLKKFDTDLMKQKEDGSWDSERTDLVIEKFLQKNAYAVKSKESKLDQSAAKGSTQKKEKSVADKLKETGFFS